MRTNDRRPRSRYISAAKAQRMLSELVTEVCTNRKRLRASQCNNSIVIYVTGGSITINVNAKGGAQ
jgi:hypothetical protein